MKKTYIAFISLMLSVSAMWGQAVVLMHVKKKVENKIEKKQAQEPVYTPLAEDYQLEEPEFVSSYKPAKESKKLQKSKLKLSAPLAVKGINQKNDMRKKAYLKKILSVSPRVSYGIAFERSYMSYQVPMLDNYLSNSLNLIANQFPWISANKLTLPPSDPNREREMTKNGKMMATVGLNIPVAFIEVEAGAGRFSDPLLTFRDVLPPWNGFGPGENIGTKINGPGTQTALSVRLGIELERILPDRWKPELNLGSVKMGLGGNIYFLASYDASYRVGAELMGNDIEQRLQNLFTPMNFIPQNSKDQAVDKIITHFESTLPAYFWVPVMRGVGYTGKGYVDIGSRLRISARYHLERTRGVSPANAEWLLKGPNVKRSFFTISLETQI
jgi:hypothetical protein